MATVTKDVTTSASTGVVATKDVATEASIALIAIGTKSVATAASVSHGPLRQVATAASLITFPPGFRPPLPTPAVFIHSPFAPGERWVQLCSAHNIDPATLRMEAGEARFHLYDGDPALTPDVRQAGNRVVIENPGFEPFVGVLLTMRRVASTGEIEVTALEETAIMGARQVPQSLSFTQPIGADSVLRFVVNEINGRSETNLRVGPLGIAPSVEQLQCGGQTGIELFRELHDRTNWEWSATYEVHASGIQSTIHFDEFQGLDLSGSFHMYEGVHFSDATWTRDASQVQPLVTAYGEFGMPMNQRQGVTRSTLLYGGASTRLGSALLQVSPLLANTALEDLAPGLRNETVIFEVMTSDKGELMRRAQRSQERTLPSQETFEDDVVLPLVDATKLRIGNIWTRHGTFGGIEDDRTVRIVGLQPDLERGVCKVASELWLR